MGVVYVDHLAVSFSSLTCSVLGQVTSIKRYSGNKLPLCRVGVGTKKSSAGGQKGEEDHLSV